MNLEAAVDSLLPRLGWDLAVGRALQLGWGQLDPRVLMIHHDRTRVIALIASVWGRVSLMARG